MSKFYGIEFCTDLDSNSPEILLSVVMPMIFTYYSMANGFSWQTTIIYDIIFGISIYLGATILKNIASKFLDSEKTISELKNDNISEDKTDIK